MRKKNYIECGGCASVAFSHYLSFPTGLDLCLDCVKKIYDFYPSTQNTPPRTDAATGRRAPGGARR